MIFMDIIILGYLPSILGLAGIMLIALISPGPDFAVMVRNSLVYSRKTAIFTALGLAFGTLIHVTYSMFGLGLLIKKNLWFLLMVKYLGASYLLYIGYRGLRAKKSDLSLGSLQVAKDIKITAAILSGFLTNILNPKCILFFISLSSVFIKPNTPIVISGIYGTIIFIETLAWFSFVAFCLSGKKTREKFAAVGYIIERITGGVLTLLGIKLLLTKVKVVA
jgi:RhtB (resistance to homoserine/threonine) family protein